MPQLTLIRHGQSTWNQEERFDSHLKVIAKHQFKHLDQQASEIR